MKQIPDFTQKNRKTNKFNGVKSSGKVNLIKEGKFHQKGQPGKSINGEPPSLISPVKLFEIFDTVTQLGESKTEEDTQDRGAKGSSKVHQSN